MFILCLNLNTLIVHTDEHNLHILCAQSVYKIVLHTYFAHISKDILELLEHFTCGIAEFTFGFLSNLCDLYSCFFKSFIQKSA